MAAYVTTGEVKTLWKSSLKAMINECRKDKKAPEGLVELVKHNLYAKYVHYDAAQDHIEIGVNEAKQRVATYPKIEVYHFPLNEVEDRLLSTCATKKADLEFYAKVFKGKRLDERMSIL